MSRTIVGRILVCIATALLLLLLFAYGTMWILVNGPSPTAKKLFVLSVKETSAGGFLADIYLSQEEIDAILSPAAGSNLAEDEQDLSMIVVPPKEEQMPEDETSLADTSDSPATAPSAETESNPPSDAYDAGIEVLDIKGSTYNGKLMIIADPGRVFVGVPDSYGADSSGLTVAKMIEKYDCVAGTNAGGFYDPNGQGTGGIPDGIVIYEGELLWGDLSATYNLAGLDGSGILHVGSMTAQRALDLGVQYAASYGPALVINGKSAGGKIRVGRRPESPYCDWTAC